MTVKNREDVQKVATIVETALNEGLKGEVVSVLMVVIGAMTGTITSLRQKGAKQSDIIAAFDIFQQELNKKQHQQVRKSV
jgi:hypothetical protein